jgi:hypothetical protein
LAIGYGLIGYGLIGYWLWEIRDNNLKKYNNEKRRIGKSIGSC